MERSQPCGLSVDWRPSKPRSFETLELMRCLRLHFFLTYGIMGSIMPFFPVYLREIQALSSVQIGTVMAVASLAVLITPVLFTWLADLKENTRNLATGIFLVSATATSLLFLNRGFGWTLLLYGLQSLALVPMLPLRDGLYFWGFQARTFTSRTPRLAEAQGDEGPGGL